MGGRQQSWRRPPAALVVCFIPAGEGEANFFRSTDNLGTRERGSGRERVHSRHSKREKGAEPYEKKSASRERHGELFA